MPQCDLEHRLACERLLRCRAGDSSLPLDYISFSFFMNTTNIPARACTQLRRGNLFQCYFMPVANYSFPTVNGHFRKSKKKYLIWLAVVIISVVHQCWPSTFTQRASYLPLGEGSISIWTSIIFTLCGLLPVLLHTVVLKQRKETKRWSAAGLVRLWIVSSSP